MLLLPLVVAAAVATLLVVVAGVVGGAVVHGHGKFMHNFSRFQKIFASLIVANSPAWRHRIVPVVPVPLLLRSLCTDPILLFSLRRCLCLKLGNINIIKPASACGPSLQRCRNVLSSSRRSTTMWHLPSVGWSCHKKKK